jgi:hypothetical protein
MVKFRVIKLVFLLVVGFVSAANGSRLPSPYVVTELSLDQAFGLLVRQHQICGRYPSTAEGLAALTKYRAMKCNADYEPENLIYDGRDGWGEPLHYSSDGDSFRIVASHGYFVTDQSPLRGHHHWENPSGGSETHDPHPPLGLRSWTEFIKVILPLVIGLVILASRKAIVRRVPENMRSSIDFASLCIGILSIAAFILFMLAFPT